MPRCRAYFNVTGRKGADTLPLSVRSFYFFRIPENPLTRYSSQPIPAQIA